jgi:hypothetical protein
LPTLGSRISKDAHPQSYPVLPMMMTESGYAIVNREAANTREAYLRTWVAGKSMDEIDGFDLKADSTVY